jgi:hypothetical protein
MRHVALTLVSGIKLYLVLSYIKLKKNFFRIDLTQFNQEFNSLCYIAHFKLKEFFKLLRFVKEILLVVFMKIKTRLLVFQKFQSLLNKEPENCKNVTCFKEKNSFRNKL